MVARLYPGMADYGPLYAPGLLARILDVVPTPAVILDREGAPVFANAAARVLVGADAPVPGEPNALGGRYQIHSGASHLRFVPEGGPLLRALSGERVFLRDVEVRQARRKVPISIEAVPITGERGGTVLAVVLFIEPRERRSEASLQARLSAVVDSSQDAIIQLAIDGRVQAWNAAAERLYGFSAAETAGKTLELFVHPDYLANMNFALKRVAAGERVEHFESLHQRKDGSRLYISATVSPVRDASGRVAALSFVARDTSDRVRAEQRQRELEDELLNARKMEALGQLATGVAHDFNTLLTVISTQAQFLRDSLATGDARRSEVDDILNAVTRGTRLTGSLVAYTREQPPHPVPLDINEVVDETAQTLRRTLDPRVKLRVTLEPHLGQILIDRVQLERLLTNLAASSCEAMPAGGELSIRTARAWIDDDSGTHAQAGAYSELTVTDTGGGLDPAIARRVFDPYVAGDDATTTHGLAAVYGIVTQAGGHIAVWSEPGVGTTFSIYLPLLGVQEEDTGEHALPPARGSETVLVVDNDRSLCATTKRILERHGYNVVYSPYGPDALAIVRDYSGSIDVVLADVVTPGSGGDDLLEALEEARPSARMLFMSGYASAGDPRRKLMGPGVSFIAKPYTNSELLYAVREALDAPLPYGASSAA